MKILKSLAIIGVVAALAVGATSAVFSDEERIEGNTFSTGTLELSVNHGELKPWDVSNMAPGQSTHWEWVAVQNVGSLGGNLTVSTQKTGGDDVLYNALKTEVRLNSPSGNLLYDGLVSGLNISRYLGSGVTETYVQRVYLPEEAGNELQGKSVVFDEIFYIQQP